MRSWGCVLNQNDCFPYKKGSMDTDTDRYKGKTMWRWKGDNRGADWIDASHEPSNAKDRWPPPGARKRRGRILSQVSEAAWVCQQLNFGYLVSRTVRNKFMLFYFIFWPCCLQDLVLHLGTEPTQWKCEVLTIGPPGNFQIFAVLKRSVCGTLLQQL